MGTLIGHTKPREPGEDKLLANVGFVTGSGLSGSDVDSVAGTIPANVPHHQAKSRPGRVGFVWVLSPSGCRLSLLDARIVIPP